MEKVKLNKSQSSILNSVKELDKKTIYFENNQLFGYFGKDKINVAGTSAIFFDLVNKGIIIKSKDGYVINPKIEWIEKNTIKIPMTI